LILWSIAAHDRSCRPRFSSCSVRSFALICGGHRAVALENLALRQQFRDGQVPRNGVSDAVATFAYRITLNVKRLRENDNELVVAGTRAFGCLNAQKKNPYKTGSEKGNVKIRRRIRRSQLIEKIGSSGWIRTSNPPVNRRKKKR